MNVHTLLLLLALSVLGACTPRDETPSATAAPATTPASQAGQSAPAAGNATLGGYRWKLDSAIDASGTRLEALFPGPKHVLTLSFESGNAAVSGGCNQMSGGYELDAQNRLTIGTMRATMMACEPALMEADQAITRLLSQPQQARIEAGTPPRLHLKSAAGDETRWIGEATAETRFGVPGERVFLEVAPQRIACNHPLIPNHQCLQVREVTFDANGIRQAPPGDWRPLFEEIEGFEFREGERKVLRLKRFKRDPVPADASATVYVLDMIVESEVVRGNK